MNSVEIEAILAGLTEPQRQAVEHMDGPLLVLAGAGSGKTRTITRRMAYLAAQGISPRNILAVTFTNKAAGEMRGRTVDLLKFLPPRTAQGITVSTFHSLCVKLLRQFAPVLGMPSAFSILDSSDQLKLVKQALEKAGISADNFTPARVLDQISGAKSRLQTPDAFAQHASGFYNTNVAKAYRSYEALLLENKAMDFDDLLLKTAFLLRDHRDVREQLQDRYRYILIDEYQDTNHAQFLIVKMLAARHQNICATGDPDQSIYAWRGANMSNILEFEKHFPNARVVLLEQNYRSTKTILKAASGLISHNRVRKQKDLWTENPIGGKILSIIAADEHQESQEIVRRLRSIHERDNVGWEKMAIFYRVNSLSRVLEAALMKSGVPYQIVRGTEFYARREVKDVLAYLKLVMNPGDSVSFERVINVPARGIGDTSVSRIAMFAAENGISHLHAASRAAEIPGLSRKVIDGAVRFARLIQAMHTKIEPTLRLSAIPENDAIDPADESANIPADSTVDFAPQADAFVPDFVPPPQAEPAAGEFFSGPTPIGSDSQPRDLPAATPELTPDTTLQPSQAAASVPSGGSPALLPVAAIIEELIRSAGFLDLKTADEESLQRASNIQELINIAAEFDLQNPGGTLLDYLTQVTLVSDTDRMKADRDAVTMMTLHAAKGLEFPVVVMAGLEEGILPHERAIGYQAKEDDIEEERRLAFVGITRAMERLIISHSSWRMIMGRSESRLRSRFISELPEECLEEVDLSQQLPAAGSVGFRDDSPRHVRPGSRTSAAVANRSHSPALSTPAMPASSAESSPIGSGFREGQLVRHPSFGLGRIAEIGDDPAQTRAVIEFQSAGRKTLILQFAKLQRVDG